MRKSMYSNHSGSILSVVRIRDEFLHHIEWRLRKQRLIAHSIFSSPILYSLLSFVLTSFITSALMSKKERCFEIRHRSSGTDGITAKA